MSHSSTTRPERPSTRRTARERALLRRVLRSTVVYTIQNRAQLSHEEFVAAASLVWLLTRPASHPIEPLVVAWKRLTVLRRHAGGRLDSSAEALRRVIWTTTSRLKSATDLAAWEKEMAQKSTPQIA